MLSLKGCIKQLPGKITDHPGSQRDPEGKVGSNQKAKRRQ